MPKRTDEHVVADIALNRVMTVFSDCGWACEVVHQDYGEDLLVQTNYQGVVDPFKIWIQVKGTRDLRRFHTTKYGYSLRVSLEHALKWARSQDLVVVVLWDVTANRGLWSIPQEDFDEWSWRNLRAKTIRLRFDEDSAFDIECAQRIAWKARIAHYDGLFLSAGSRDLHYARYGDDVSRRKSKHYSWVPLIAFDFLRLLLIIGNDQVDDTFMRSLRNETDAIRKKDTTLSNDDIRKMAITLAVLGRIHHLSHGCGVPIMFLESCCEVLEKFLDALAEPTSSITIGIVSNSSE